MKRTFLGLCLVCLSSVALANTDVDLLAANPKSYDGKTVEICGHPTIDGHRNVAIVVKAGSIFLGFPKEFRRKDSFRRYMHDYYTDPIHQNEKGLNLFFSGKFEWRPEFEGSGRTLIVESISECKN